MSWRILHLPTAKYATSFHYDDCCRDVSFTSCEQANEILAKRGYTNIWSGESKPDILYFDALSTVNDTDIKFKLHEFEVVEVNDD